MYKNLQAPMNYKILDSTNEYDVYILKYSMNTLTKILYTKNNFNYPLILKMNKSVYCLLVICLYKAYYLI